MFKRLRSLLIIFAVCSSLAAKADHQPLTYHRAKAHYIVEVIKHVTPKQEDKTTPFVIGIIGKDANLIKAFNHYTAELLIRNKKLTMKSIKDTGDRFPYAVVLLSARKLRSIEEINKQYPNALIISDGEVIKKEQMVSLISNAEHTSIKITLNRENIVKRGYKISNSMLNFAGTKEDLSIQLKEHDAQMKKQESYLKSLLSDVVSKEKQLNDLNQFLINKSKILEQTQQDLSEKTLQLRQSQTQLKEIQQQRQEMQQEVEDIRKNIQQQQSLILSKQAEVEEQELHAQRLHAQIELNRSKLESQLAELAEQDRVIAIKEQTISNQRILLYVAISVTVIFLILAFFLLHINKLRKKANAELISLNEQLYYLATTDSMTKLFNRRHFLESAQTQVIQMQRTNSPCVVLMMDIDNFKTINDTYGHAVGDQAIIDVADVFLKNLRKYDIVGRLGGEEFAMVLTSCQIDKAKQIAERIREKVAQLSCKVNGTPIILTISIGLTPLTEEDKDVESVLQRADKALYKAKDAGRNTVVILEN